MWYAGKEVLLSILVLWFFLAGGLFTVALRWRNERFRGEEVGK
jgi:hypothetical protein